MHEWTEIELRLLRFSSTYNNRKKRRCVVNTHTGARAENSCITHLTCQPTCKESYCVTQNQQVIMFLELPQHGNTQRPAFPECFPTKLLNSSFTGLMLPSMDCRANALQATCPDSKSISKTTRQTVRPDVGFGA